MRILLLTPFTTERLALEELLRGVGDDVTSAPNRDEALRWVATHRPDAIIADVQVPALDGHSLVRELSLAGASQVVLLCPRRAHALDRPGVTCLTKPIAFTELHRSLRPTHVMETHAP